MGNKFGIKEKNWVKKIFKIENKAKLKKEYNNKVIWPSHKTNNYKIFMISAQ